MDSQLGWKHESKSLKSETLRFQASFLQRRPNLDHWLLVLKKQLLLFVPKIWCRFNFGPSNNKSLDLVLEIKKMEQFGLSIYFSSYVTNRNAKSPHF